MLLSPEHIEAALQSEDRATIEAVYLATRHPYYAFEPRPDDANNHEEQSSFCDAGYRFDDSLNRFVYDEPAIRFKVLLGRDGLRKNRCFGVEKPPITFSKRGRPNTALSFG
jgi:hypothetical protein